MVAIDEESHVPAASLSAHSPSRAARSSWSTFLKVQIVPYIRMRLHYMQNACVILHTRNDADTPSGEGEALEGEGGGGVSYRAKREMKMACAESP